MTSFSTDASTSPPITLRDRWSAFSINIGYGVLFIILLAFPLHIDIDVAYLLETGNRLLDGNLPYVDFYEINFPGSFYLSAVPVALSRLFGGSAVTWMILLVFALTLVSAQMVKAILRRIRSQPLLSGTVVSLLYIVLTGITMMFALGQREHLLMLGLTPWLFLRWLRARHGDVPAGWAIIVGAAAAFAATLKPHHVLAFVLPELFLLVVYRRLSLWWKPEMIGVGLAGALYGTYLIMHPELMRVYLDEIVPVTAQGYSAFGDTSTTTLILQNASLLLLMVVAFIVARRRRLMDWSPLWLWSLTLVGTVFGYAVQEKGWDYHRLPVIWSAVWLIGLIIAAWLRTDTRSMVRLLSAVTVVVLLVAALARSLRPLGAGDPALLTALETHTEPGDVVLWLNTYLPPAFPTIEQAGVWQASPYFLTGGVLEIAYAGTPLETVYDGSSALPPLAERFVEDTLSALNDPRVDVVLIADRVPEFGNMRLNAFTYTQSRPEWMEVLDRDFLQAERISDHVLYLRRVG